MKRDGAVILATAGTVAALLSFVGGYVSVVYPRLGSVLLGTAGAVMLAGNLLVLWAGRVRQAEPQVPFLATWGDGSPDRGTLLEVAAETRRARAKFPGNRFMVVALQEEVGELAKAHLQRRGYAQIRREATQVAAVAIRIIEEGDKTFADVTDAEAKP